MYSLCLIIASAVPSVSLFSDFYLFDFRFVLCSVVRLYFKRNSLEGTESFCEEYDAHVNFCDSFLLANFTGQKEKRFMFGVGWNQLSFHGNPYTFRSNKNISSFHSSNFPRREKLIFLNFVWIQEFCCKKTKRKTKNQTKKKLFDWIHSVSADD